MRDKQRWFMGMILFGVILSVVGVIIGAPKPAAPFVPLVFAVDVMAIALVVVTWRAAWGREAPRERRDHGNRH
jgi:hypothetical protein